MPGPLNESKDDADLHDEWGNIYAYAMFYAPHHNILGPSNSGGWLKFSVLLGDFLSAPTKEICTKISELPASAAAGDCSGDQSEASA
jgi:hypothetical protein